MCGLAETADSVEWLLSSTAVRLLAWRWRALSTAWRVIETDLLLLIPLSSVTARAIYYSHCFSYALTLCLPRFICTGNYMCLLRVILLLFFNRNTTYVILLFFRIKRNFPRNCLQILKDSVYPKLVVEAPPPPHKYRKLGTDRWYQRFDWFNKHIGNTYYCSYRSMYHNFVHVTAFVIKLLWIIQIFDSPISFKPKSRPLGHFAYLSCIHSRLLCYTNFSCFKN